MRREHVLSVHIGPTERAAWERARAASSSRWLAQWCRESMAFAIRQNRTAVLRKKVDADAHAVQTIHRLASQLNRETKHAHQVGIIPPEVDSVATSLLDLARRCAPGVGGQTGTASARETQSELVNVRLSDEELALWSALSETCGFERVATWVRYTLAGLLAVELPPIAQTAPEGLTAIRYDLGGAVTNFSQLRDVAGSWSDELAERFDHFGAEAVALLRLYRESGA